MKFEKDGFNFDGMYLTYLVDGERKFVARFKRGGMGHFKSFLVKNFTVEEYFSMLETMTPMDILFTKGYCSPAMMKVKQMYGVSVGIITKQEAN